MTIDKSVVMLMPLFRREQRQRLPNKVMSPILEADDC